MNILTGNDLKTGDVIWWAGGESWSRHIAEAQDAGDDGDTILAREEAARRVNGSYIIAADPTDNGPLPVHIKERVRASGPTVRSDLAINTEIPIVNA